MSGDVAVYLTQRQVEILTLLSEGVTFPKIAEKLGCSRGAVNSCVAHAYAKLGARSAAHAVRLGFEHGILTGSEAVYVELARVYRALAEANAQIVGKPTPMVRAHAFGAYLLGTGQAA